jgi:hypothetical protein
MRSKRRTTERAKDFFWYLKYLSASTILVAILLHTIPEAYPINVVVHLIGAIMWTIVGIKWKEGAVLLNFLPQIFILGTGLIVNYLR